MWTEGRTDMKKPIVAFRHFENVPKWTRNFGNKKYLNTKEEAACTEHKDVPNNIWLQNG
jgi:hypothetical protein